MNQEPIFDLIQLSDEQIVNLYLYSKDLQKLEFCKAALYQEISEIELSNERSPKIYKRKKRLEYYFSQLVKKIKKIEEQNAKKAASRNKYRKAAKETQDKLQALVAQGLLNYLARTNNMEIAREKMLNVVHAERELSRTVQDKQADIEFSVAVAQKLKELIANGMAGSDKDLVKTAIKEVTKDLQGPDYRSPVNSIDELNPNDLETLEDNHVEIQKQFGVSSLDQIKMGPSLMDSPLETELKPIRLSHDPTKEQEK